jgi:hypothetical protein
MDHPVRYQVRIRIRGELAPRWSAVLGDLELAPGPDGTTVLSGDLADQAAVHGLLDSIRDLGLSLVSVETVVVAPSTTRGAS